MTATAWYARGPRGAGIQSGAGAPSPTVGDDGDLYLNTSNGDLYERADGAWTVSGNVKGPTGRGYTGITVAGDVLKFAGSDGVSDSVTVPELTAADASATAAAASATAAGGSATAAAQSASDAAASAAAAAAEGVVTGSVNGTATGLILWTGTADQFAAVATKDPATIYTYPGGIWVGATPVLVAGTVNVIVTIDHTKVAGDLTEFPVYVNLADMPAAWWKTVRDGGADIRCWVGGKEVPREVVFCSTQYRIGELWIKADLSSTVDTVIKISVDGVSPQHVATEPLGRHAVWSDGYVGVWHLQGNGNDSTQYANNGTTTATTTTPGIISAGLGFDGANPSKVEIPAADSLYLTPNNQWQMSAWVKTPGVPNVVLRSAARGYVLSVPTSSSAVRANFGVSPAVDTQVFAGTSNKFTANAWHQWAGGYDGTKLFLAVDGGNYETKTPTAGTTLVFEKDKTFIGANATFGGGVTGVIDEVRISNKARSQAWIATEYANQMAPASFYTVEV